MIVQQKVIVLESYTRESILQSFWPKLKLLPTNYAMRRTQKHRFDENVEFFKVSTPKSHNFISKSYRN